MKGYFWTNEEILLRSKGIDKLRANILIQTDCKVVSWYNYNYFFNCCFQQIKFEWRVILKITSLVYLYTTFNILYTVI